MCVYLCVYVCARNRKTFIFRHFTRLVKDQRRLMIVRNLQNTESPQVSAQPKIHWNFSIFGSMTAFFPFSITQYLFGTLQNMCVCVYFLNKYSAIPITGYQGISIDLHSLYYIFRYIRNNDAQNTNRFFYNA